MNLLDAIQAHPASGALAAVALLIAATIISRAGRRRGARTVTADPRRAQNRRDRLLFAAAFGAAAVVYAALLCGSFEGLTTWARETLKWIGWQQYIVPISVDGLGTAAGALAFRAVRAKTSPYACYAMVWGATGTSMAVNAIQGGKHGATAAFYMAFLSLAVMAMFHLFLGQFQAGAEYVGAKYPRFGLRWVTYWQTPADFLCWVNHPPAGDLEPSVGNAVAHRQAWKADRRQAAEAAAVAVHDRKLAAARRAAELAATKPAVAASTEPAGTPETGPELPPGPRQATKPARRPAARTRTTRQNRPATKAETTAEAVARERKTNPDATQAQIAARLKVSERTVRSYWTPDNVTPIHKEAAQ